MKHQQQYSASRREFLNALMLPCAALLSPALLAGDPTAIKRSPGNAPGPGIILSREQMRLLAAIADVIIPRTDTASASEVDVHGVIDDQLAHCRVPEAAKEFINNLSVFAARTRSHVNKEFHECKTEEQYQAVRALVEQEIPYEKINPAWFGELKSLIVLSYYTSEVGASKELVYDPIPGGFDGYFKLSENDGRAFSIYHI